MVMPTTSKPGSYSCPWPNCPGVFRSNMRRSKHMAMSHHGRWPSLLSTLVAAAAAVEGDDPHEGIAVQPTDLLPHLQQQQQQQHKHRQQQHQQHKQQASQHGNQVSTAPLAAATHKGIAVPTPRLVSPPSVLSPFPRPLVAPAPAAIAVWSSTTGPLVSPSPPPSASPAPAAGPGAATLDAAAPASSSTTASVHLASAASTSTAATSCTQQSSSVAVLPPTVAAPPTALADQPSATTAAAAPRSHSRRPPPPPPPVPSPAYAQFAPYGLPLYPPSSALPPTSFLASDSSAAAAAAAAMAQTLLAQGMAAVPLSFPPSPYALNVAGAPMYVGGDFSGGSQASDGLCARARGLPAAHAARPSLAQRLEMPYFAQRERELAQSPFHTHQLHYSAGHDGGMPLPPAPSQMHSVPGQALPLLAMAAALPSAHPSSVLLPLPAGREFSAYPAAGAAPVAGWRCTLPQCGLAFSSIYDLGMHTRSHFAAFQQPLAPPAADASEGLASAAATGAGASVSASTGGSGGGGAAPESPPVAAERSGRLNGGLGGGVAGCSTQDAQVGVSAGGAAIEVDGRS